MASKKQPSGNPEKLVRVTCKANDYLPLESLCEFQGNLCELTEDSMDKAKHSILKHGLFLPEAIWQNEGKNHIIDGHARVRTLRQMQTEGYIIPKVPVIFVEAATEAEAKEKVLLARSQYHKTTDEGLYQFIHTNLMDWDELKLEVSFPEINMQMFEDGYMKDFQGNPNDQKEYDENIPTENECPKCGYKW